jgi:hypothetical protein
MIVNPPKCKQCGNCCKYSWHRIGKDDSNYVIFLKTKYPTGYIGDGLYDGEIVKIFYMPEPCSKLINNKCLINDDKPEVCKIHCTHPHCFYPRGCVFFDYWLNFLEAVDEIGC